MTDWKALLRSANPALAIDTELRRRVATGESRDDLVAELEGLRSELDVNVNPEDEDLVLDAMDALVGFTGPHSRI